MTGFGIKHWEQGERAILAARGGRWRFDPDWIQRGDDGSACTDSEWQDENNPGFHSVETPPASRLGPMYS
jgi:hypothetical protein